MNIQKILGATFLIAFSLGLFYSCDKIEEPFFKPVYSDRNTVTELVTDSASLDPNLYNQFTTLNATSNSIIPLVILSNDNDAGYSLASTYQVDNGEAMINRVQNNSKFGIDASKWTQQLSVELDKKGEFNLEIDGSYKQASQNYEGTLSITSNNGCDFPVNYSILAVEDSVEINSVNCMNVLRKTEENQLVATSMQRSQKLDKTINFDLSSLNYISKTKLIFILQNGNTKEILQAIEEPLTGLEFSKQQNVLIEDFTGQHCTYCPKAHEELARLQNLYGKKVVGMAIHYGWQADADAEFPVDYKTEVGTAIGDHFADQSEPLPFGFINRIKHGSKYKLDWAQWDAEVNRLTPLPAKVGIAISEAKIENGTLTSSVYVKAFEQLDTIVKIQGFIIESHLHSKQKFYEAPWEIDDYEQNHVLRASINGIWGEELASAPISQNQIINKNFTFTVDNAWVPENLDLIIMVYNSVSEEILQVEEIPIH